ncbi:MAG: L-rhamnose isomerase [Defluviitaleaceae bacterium]|nr:L-rhamnose isomerase [Defluviitaleaceae bacterium]
MSSVEQSYSLAKDRYQSIGVDTGAALEKLKTIPISLNCWQGDDVRGFENADTELSNGLAVTGAYPGRARGPEELRQDIDKAMSMIPGTKKLALHAMYLESGDKPVDRDAVRPEHFKNWAAWAKEKGFGLDFNPTFMSHPKSEPFTLASPDDKIREFWVNHGVASRRVGEYLGKETGKTCVTNIWIPDGFKDTPVDRFGARQRLKDSLDRVLAEKIDPVYNLDAVESKLFGIGSESCVIGSHEFYLSYALKNNVLYTLDTGHFHPTELISDKLSSILTFMDKVYLHVSRSVRWDSDHVVTFTDELKEIALEIIRNDFTGRVYIGLDFFDGSINRLAAWAIGSRNMAKALLYALLEPSAMLKKAELEGDYTTRLAMLEELRSFPFGAVWDYYCLANGAPVGTEWLDEVRKYEADVLAKRK